MGSDIKERRHKDKHLLNKCFPNLLQLFDKSLSNTRVISLAEVGGFIEKKNCIEKSLQKAWLPSAGTLPCTLH